MATIPITISGGNPPFSISVKRDTSTDELYQGYTGGVVQFAGYLDGQNHTYTITVANNTCNPASATFNLTCGTPCSRLVIEGPVKFGTYLNDNESQSPLIGFRAKIDGVYPNSGNNLEASLDNGVTWSVMNQQGPVCDQAGITGSYFACTDSPCPFCMLPQDQSEGRTLYYYSGDTIHLLVRLKDQTDCKVDLGTFTIP